MQRLLISGLLLLSSLLFAACTSTPQDRISADRAAFNRFPSAVQKDIIEGRVAIGFTEEMVTMALGKPGRVYSRADASGQSDVWVYFRRQPSFSFGFGVGSGSYGRGVSTGVGVSTSTERLGDDEAMRVVFQNGAVTAVETTTSVR